MPLLLVNFTKLSKNICQGRRYLTVLNTTQRAVPLSIGFNKIRLEPCLDQSSEQRLAKF